MKRSQTKKRVLITGAGTGIGFACVQKFLHNNWDVLAHFNTNSKELVGLQKKHGNAQLKIVCSDFSSKAQALEFISSVKDESFDALVNNAALYDMSIDKKDRVSAIQEVLLVNTIIPVLLAETVLEGMKLQQKGAIVNVSSIGVKFGSNLKSVFYSISKGGLEVMTKTLAREGAPFNILVNNIRPGVTNTSFHDKLGKNMDARKAMIPLKRLAEPAEIADYIYFLCETNKFMTGETISVSGGE